MYQPHSSITLLVNTIKSLLVIKVLPFYHCKNFRCYRVYGGGPM